MGARALDRRPGGGAGKCDLSGADPADRDLACGRDSQAGGVSERPELRATYRLQLNSGFGFADARALVPYLRDLGISHLYLSPSFQARPGSTHGYDVIDPGKLSDALGGEDGLRALADTAHAHGMGLILDIVPNHMAADDGNRFW